MKAIARCMGPEWCSGACYTIGCTAFPEGRAKPTESVDHQALQLAQIKQLNHELHVEMERLRVENDELRKQLNDRIGIGRPGH